MELLSSLKGAGAISEVIAAFLGLLALVVSLWQGYLSRKVARAQFMPLIDVDTEDYAARKSIRLSNRGSGPAKVTSIRLSRNGSPFDFGQDTPCIARMFSFAEAIQWGTYREFGSRPWYLMPGETIELATITQGLRGVNEETFLAWKREVVGIGVSVQFEDTLGGKHDYQMLLS